MLQGFLLVLLAIGGCHTHAETRIALSSDKGAPESLTKKKSGKKLIVTYKNDKGKDAAVSVASAVNNDLVAEHLVAITVEDEATELFLRANEDVEMVEEDTIWTLQGEFEGYVHANSTGARALREDVGYGIPLVQADRLTPPNRRDLVSICLVDTGVASSHEDLNFNKLKGAGRTSDVDGSWLSWNNDVQGHGTHTAGIIAARIGNDVGVRGTGDLELFITRGLGDDGRATQSDVIDALSQCEAQNARIISLSLGGPSISTAMKNKYESLANKGFLLVAASGNQNSDKPFYPAALKEVISVAAIDVNENRWERRQDLGSNTGKTIELSAAGASIVSTLPNNSYGSYSGTSMAAPFVSGVASMLWSRNPKCTAQQIRYAMAYTARSLHSGGGDCSEEFGYGVLRGNRAKRFLKDHSCLSGDWGRSFGNGECSTIDSKP